VVAFLKKECQITFCYKTGTDVMIFKNIFDEEFSKKIGVFDSKQSK
jgi:hypothetical protein